MDFLYNNFIADFFTWCLKGFNSIFLNYAITVIVLTILVRLVMLPLDLQQRKNQSKMSALGPEIQSLQKRYANNPQQLQRKQQELYRKMNVHPMLGCLPMIIQMPILFAFFGAMRMLQSEQTVSILLNAAQYGADTITLPSFFWVHNIWQPDAGNAPILPAAAEFLGWVQQYASNITPQALSLMQHKGILTFDTLNTAGISVVSVNSDLYNKMIQTIVESNGVPYVATDTGMQPSSMNGWFILPALSGVALFLQQKFNPQAAASTMAGAAGQNPEQEQAQGCSNKMMLWIFPIFSIWICVTSPATFALYWFTSSLYAFAQSKVIGFFQKRKANKQQLVVSGTVK